MLCYRCGSHVPDSAESCPSCGQQLSGGGVRHATGTFSRRRLGQLAVDGAPYKPQDVIAGRYLVKDTIGAGPLGVVFRVQDREADVEVVLKSINPKLVQTSDEKKGFARVMRAARKVSHANIARLYEDGEDQDRPYFTEQFLDGLSLRKIIDLRLQKGQFFAVKEVEPILAQLCAAMDAAHKVTPHGDLRPENVLVLPDLLKVTDLALGLAMPRVPFVQALRAKKADRYLAPELIEGGEADGRVDVYSLAVIVGEMLSGLLPDGAAPELSRRNPEVPPAIEGLYRKALNSNPAARFRTAGEFMQDWLDVSRRLAPPPLKPRTLSQAGVTLPRPRTTTGMLQLKPRDLPSVVPPPPPPVTGEVDMRAVVAGGADDKRPPPPVPDEIISAVSETASVPNGHAGDADDLAETRVGQPALADPASRQAALWLGALVLVGLLAGAVFGYLWWKRQVPVDVPVTVATGQGAAPAQPQGDPQVQKEAEEARRLALQKADEDAARLAAAEQAEAERKSAQDAARARDDDARKRAYEREAERQAAERATTQAEKERLAQERALLEKQQARAAEQKVPETKSVTVPTVVQVPAGPVRAAGEGTCPEGMSYIAAGSFKMGTPNDDPMRGFDEKQLSSVKVSAFCIDAYEFPNKKGGLPTGGVTWGEARQACETRGARLCSEEEWEKACKGPGGSRWPYGNTFDPQACNSEDDSGEDRSLATSGKFSRCRSRYGVYDLSGNMAEWTESKAQKGGTFAKADFAVRCSARKVAAPSAKSTDVGFRCCLDSK